MTPTNDAPVTVEQCDLDAAADWIGGDEGRWLRGDDPYWVSGSPDNTPLVQAFARHRLAALASAPAGDGVEAMRVALERSREGWSNAIEFGIIPPQHRNSAKILADECAAALARPRAAVETVEFVREWLMSGDHPVSDWERQFAAAIDARPRAAVGEREAMAQIAEHYGRCFGEKAPYGEPGTNLVWSTAHAIAERIRGNEAVGEREL